jgi:hypothetical protein
MLGILLEKLMPRKEHYNSDDKEDCKDNSWIAVIVFLVIGGLIAALLANHTDFKIFNSKLFGCAGAFVFSYIYIFYYLFKLIRKKSGSVATDTPVVPVTSVAKVSDTAMPTTSDTSSIGTTATTPILPKGVVAVVPAARAKTT